MSLIQRLAKGLDDEGNGKLPILTFQSALFEIYTGNQTEEAVVGYFGLDETEAAELHWLVETFDAYGNDPTPVIQLVNKMYWFHSLSHILYLIEAQVPGYQTDLEIVARIEAV